MDTRSGVGGPIFGTGEQRSLVVTGTAGIPSNAVAVSLNVTVTEPSEGGYVTVWPAGAGQPPTSNLNFLRDQTVPNMVTVGVGSGGAINLANAFGTSHLIVDVMGYFESGFNGVAPVRLMDTRTSLGGPTLGPATTRTLTVAGVSGIPAEASAVALNVTATNPSLGGYLTVWPAGTSQPPSSNLNMVRDQTVANMVLVGVGAGGQISVFNSTGSTDVLVDVMGWFSAGGSFTGINPARLLDTRSATCGVRLEAGETRTLSIAGRGAVPASGVGGVALNVTVTDPSQTSYITVWPAGGARPNTSNLNMTEGQTVPNMVTVGLGTAGQVNFFNAFGTVDLIVDVMGYFPGDTPGGSPVDCPPVIHTFADGTHVVGQDVPPGRYVTTAATSGCYWERTKGFSGSLNDVIANDIGDGQRIVDIKPGDVGFDSTRCGTWRTFVASNYIPSTSFGTGVYAVGSQVAPGRYQATGTTDCYWERVSGFGGDFKEVIANEIGSGTRIVDVSASDVGIASSRCGTWVRIG